MPDLECARCKKMWRDCRCTGSQQRARAIDRQFMKNVRADRLVSYPHHDRLPQESDRSETQVR